MAIGTDQYGGDQRHCGEGIRDHARGETSRGRGWATLSLADALDFGERFFLGTYLFGFTEYVIHVGLFECLVEPLDAVANGCEQGEAGAVHAGDSAPYGRLIEFLG